jgi:hypothetical protein
MISGALTCVALRWGGGSGGGSASGGVGVHPPPRARAGGLSCHLVVIEASREPLVNSSTEFRQRVRALR